jgi:hypothetical protein
MMTAASQAAEPARSAPARGQRVASARYADHDGAPALPGTPMLAGGPAGGGTTGYLNAIAGGPRSTWAAGWYRQSAINVPLFDRLEGTSWRAVAGKLAGEYDSIEGVSARTADDAWAVGAFNRTGRTSWLSLTEHWNGARWVRVPSPNPGVTVTGKSIMPDNVLYGVADVAPRDSWAVGEWDQPALPAGENTGAILLHFDGTSWRQVTAPDPLGLPRDYAFDAIAARSAHDIWIAGGYPITLTTGKLLIEHYNGQRWSIVKAPSPGLSASISSLSLGADGTVWAAGTYNVLNKAGSAIDDKTLILRWNGSTWRQVPSPDPSAGFSVLTGISASTSGGAWAVGGYNTDPANGTEHPDRTLTLQWSEGKWHAVPSPDPGDMGNYLYGVLDTRSGPVAVGEADSGTIPNLTVKPLMIRWNGSQWEPVTVPVPRP